MKILASVKLQTKRVRSSSPAGAPASVRRVGRRLRRRVIDRATRTASQTSPASTDEHECRTASRSRIRITRPSAARGSRPTAEPLLKMPDASARSFSGNHSATTLTAPASCRPRPCPAESETRPGSTRRARTHAASPPTDHHSDAKSVAEARAQTIDQRPRDAVHDRVREQERRRPRASSPHCSCGTARAESARPRKASGDPDS